MLYCIISAETLALLTSSFLVGWKRYHFWCCCMAGDHICHCPILDAGIAVPVYAPYGTAQHRPTANRLAGGDSMWDLHWLACLHARHCASRSIFTTALPQKALPPPLSLSALTYSTRVYTVPPTSTTMAMPLCNYRWEDRWRDRRDLLPTRKKLRGGYIWRTKDPSWLG